MTHYLRKNPGSLCCRVSWLRTPENSLSVREKPKLLKRLPPRTWPKLGSRLAAEEARSVLTSGMARVSSWPVNDGNSLPDTGRRGSGRDNNSASAAGL